MKLKNTFSLLTVIFLCGSFTILFAQKEKSHSKPAKPAKITMARPRQAASNRVAGKIESAELEREAGKLIYSFDIRNAQGTISEVWVDASNAEVIKVEKENAAQEAREKRQDKMKAGQKDDDEESEASQKANQAKYARQAKITMEQARRAALEKIPGTIIDAELEKEKGKLMYSFDIRAADGKVFDVEIDAETGKILKAVEDSEDSEDDN